jgi:pimeloyl-ACP methyl ester carboxylesterase
MRSHRSSLDNATLSAAMQIRTLVLLPGMDGTASLFDGFVDALGAQIKTIAISYDNTTPMGYAKLTDYVRARLPVDEPYILLAESFSGPIAVALAAECLPHLRGLILCCTFVRNPRPGLDWLKPMLGILPMLRPPQWMLKALLLSANSSPASQASLFKAVAQVAPSVMRARLQAVLSVNMTVQMAAVKVPTLYLRASKDRLVLASAADLITSLNANTQVVDIDAPHAVLQVAPQAAVRAIDLWIADYG